MSFLSLLLFASAFYFAQGMQFMPWEFGNYGHPVHFNPVEVMEYPSAYKEQTSKFLQAVGTAIDTHIKPLLSNLSDRKQEELKTMGLNDAAAYVDYILGGPTYL